MRLKINLEAARLAEQATLDHPDYLRLGETALSHLLASVMISASMASA
jgi:hypothetical protein